MYRTSRYPMMQPLVNSGMGMAPFFKVTVFEQEHFQGKCLEFTSECCNIQECGLDNIRSIRSHQSSRMMIFERENFMGRSVELCDDYPSLQAMGWMWPEVGSMHVQCGARNNRPRPDSTPLLIYSRYQSVIRDNIALFKAQGTHTLHTRRHN
ncbi:Beta-crystallin A3-2 [Larimichthys crocea]|uniref:Uncharacterized protein n=1 Tax=Larimichthys crocea TaxID=215358 RepID=A0ACD3RDH8_LARCR|nr:Beta-crystallin A3-2 [Larimichthys crocea]